MFDRLAANGNSTTDKGKVVYLLAGLPESNHVLVTALESGTLETVTEQILREKQKLNDREDTDDSFWPRTRIFRERSLAITARILAIRRRTAEISSSSVK